MKVYLDNAATTPIYKEVVAEMIPFLENFFGNPSSTHSHGREVKVALERARKKIASLIGAQPSEIFFTSGGTESDNTAIRCYVEKYGLKHAITSRLEHHAVLHTLEGMAAKGIIKLSFVSHDEKGNIDLEDLERLLKDNEQSLVSLMHGNNEVGTISDLAQIGSICQQYNAIYHSDTVQTMGYYPIDLKNLPVDAVVGAAHKFHGPKGVGFLYINSQKKIPSFITGGSQERNMRGGTENIAGIIGMVKALELCFEHQAENKEYVLSLKKHMKSKLKEKIPGVSFNGMSGDLENSVYKVLNISLPLGWGNDMLLFNLDLKGVSASGGSACSSGANKGSHVLQALGVDAKRRSIRFSFSKFNTVEEIDYTIEKLIEVAQPASVKA